MRSVRDREAADALRLLGFWDAERIVGEQGHERVLAAIAYVQSRRNVKGQGAYVRRLLREESIPAPLLWEERPAPGEPLRWNDYRSLDGHLPEDLWVGEPEEGATAFWVLCLADLKGQVTRPNFESWLKGTVGLALRHGELVVGAADAFTLDWLRGKMGPLLAKVASGLLEEPTEVRIVLFEGGSYGDETDRGGGDDGVHREREPRQEPAGQGDR